jgi:iron complex transport system substrate-binding protein
MAEVMGRDERAKEVIDFIEAIISDLSTRTAGISEDQKKSCYVGGIAFKGPHGFQSTEPAYPPFLFIKARNVAFAPSMETKQLQHSNVAKESIVSWDPEILFLDVSTLQSEPQSSALYELQHDPAYRGLSAVRAGKVYGLLPYNWYSFNYGSILANSYYCASVLFPEAFGDISPRKKADEIYSFLVGKPVFEELNEAFDSLAFGKISM